MTTRCDLQDLVPCRAWNDKTCSRVLPLNSNSMQNTPPQAAQLQPQSHKYIGMLILTTQKPKGSTKPLHSTPLGGAKSIVHDAKTCDAPVGLRSADMPLTAASKW